MAANPNEKKSILPTSVRLQPEGESGRSGFHPLKFLYICGRSGNKVSACVNILWPFVPAAFVLVRGKAELPLPRAPFLQGAPCGTMAHSPNSEPLVLVLTLTLRSTISDLMMSISTSIDSLLHTSGWCRVPTFLALQAKSSPESFPKSWESY